MLSLLRQVGIRDIRLKIGTVPTYSGHVATLLQLVLLVYSGNHFDIIWWCCLVTSALNSPSLICRSICNQIYSGDWEVCLFSASLVTIILTRATTQRGFCESRQVCRTSTVCTIWYQILYKKCLVLKIRVKVMEYNIHNGVFPWWISTSMHIIISHVCSWKFTSSSRNSTFTVVPFDGKNEHRCHFHCWCSSYYFQILTF